MIKSKSKGCKHRQVVNMSKFLGANMYMDPMLNIGQNIIPYYSHDICINKYKIVQFFFVKGLSIFSSNGRYFFGPTTINWGPYLYSSIIYGNIRFSVHR